MYSRKPPPLELVTVKRRRIAGRLHAGITALEAAELYSMRLALTRRKLVKTLCFEGLASKTDVFTISGDI